MLNAVSTSGIFVQRDDGDIWAVNGTSFPAPAACGMLTCYIQWRNENNLSKLTPAEVRRFNGFRLQYYDGGLYGAYGYSNLFAIVHKVKIRTQKIQVASGTVLIPIYNPSVGMVGKDQLRISTPSGIGCYELVDVSAANASPLRVSTSGGIRAISK